MDHCDSGILLVKLTKEAFLVGNVEALNCYYADGEKKRSLHRRSYWMLNPEYEHVVLVHYRDTKISAADKTQSTPDTSTQPAGDVSKGPSKGEPSKAAVETDTTTEVLVEENPPKDNPNGETSKDDASSMEFVHTNSTSQANPDNSNEQMDFDDAFLPEAEEGGSEILPESLTSKLSASIGMSEGEFDNMRNSQPDLALQLLMDKKCELAQNSSSDIGGTSNRSDAGIRQRQDSLLHKFHSEYLNGDVLKSIEENANAAFAHKNFLNHLHNLRIDEATLTNRSVETLAAMKAQKITSVEEVQECVSIIEQWEQEIANLKAEIVKRELLIRSERQKRQQLKEAAANAHKEAIEKEAREGLKYFSASEALDDDVKYLQNSIQVIDVELTLIKTHYASMKSKP
ncbi:hypothetical protein TSUD_128030 [Trifolium subterraneum]|nr:hypothetical protein TSUD_128030 [Trifolium subterraneum]